MERWILSGRRELLDRTPIWDQHRLLRALREFEAFDNHHRPHQGVTSAMLARHGGRADIGNLHVSGQYRRRGIATWLLGQAAGWLRLAQVERLLDHAWPDGEDPAGQDYAGYRAFLAASGFSELTRTKQGWMRTPHQQ